jgi:hypothetical protein
VSTTASVLVESVIPRAHDRNQLVVPHRNALAPGMELGRGSWTPRAPKRTSCTTSGIPFTPVALPSMSDNLTEAPRPLAGAR